MNSLLITGYKAFELGILTAKDPRLPIIKEAIRRDLVRFLEEGVQWLIFTGNLGFEAWVLEVAQELKKEYENYIILQYSCSIYLLLQLAIFFILSYFRPLKYHELYVLLNTY